MCLVCTVAFPETVDIFFYLLTIISTALPLDINITGDMNILNPLSFKLGFKSLLFLCNIKFSWLKKLICFIRTVWVCF